LALFFQIATKTRRHKGGAAGVVAKPGGPWQSTASVGIRPSSLGPSPLIPAVSFVSSCFSRKGWLMPLSPVSCVLSPVFYFVRYTLYNGWLGRQAQHASRGKFGLQLPIVSIFGLFSEIALSGASMGILCAKIRHHSCPGPPICVQC
jgi:hypothetical protein